MAYTKIEPSGCEVWHGGLVKVRFDLFLEPDDARYNERHTLVPVIPVGGYPGRLDKEGIPTKQADYDAWLASLPHTWQLAPFHSHFLRFEPDVSQEQVEQAILPHIPNFYKAWCEECDKLPDGMRKGWDVATRFQAIGRPRRYDKEFTLQELGTHPTECLSKLNLIIASNLSTRSKDIGETFPATAIDIGPGAVNRAAIYGGGGYTIIDLENPANDTGFLDTMQFYFDTDCTGAKAGTFSGSGTSYTNRDVETIGDFLDDATRTFTGLDCDVVTGDFIGVYWTSGNLDLDSSGYTGDRRKSGDQFGAGTQTYSSMDGYAISLYGTGDTEPPVVAPTVTTQAATSVQATTATGNGNITDTGGENCDYRGIAWDIVSRGDPGGLSPAASAYAHYVSQGPGSYGTGAFTRSLTGLPTGDTIYARAYAHNSEGWNWGAQVSFLTEPAAPTNVAATDGTYTDKVRITWTKSTGATGYKVYEGVNLLDTLGDVATYDDNAAGAPTITAGAAVASDGTIIAHVALNLTGESANNGASRTYKVKALNATGDSVDSSTNAGYRGVGALTYQWQRSDADSDANYNTNLGTTEAYNDTTAPADGSGRYYRCVENATGAAQQISSVNRGYRAVARTKSLSDSVAIVDSPALAATFSRAYSDSVAIADAIVKGIGQPQSDSLAIADSPANVVAFIRAYADTVAIADDISKGIGQPQADSLAIADSFAKVVAFHRSLSDSVTITDSIADIVEWLLSVDDTVTIGDVVAKSVGLTKVDSVALADSLTKVSEFLKSLQDNETITDSEAKVVGVNLSDTIVLADAISKSVGLPFADSVTIADFLIIGSAYNLSFSDTIALTDSITKDIGLTETDSVALADSLAKVSEFIRTHSDTVTITDSIADVVEWLLSVDDTVAVSDAVAKAVGLPKADTVTITDSFARVVTFIQAFADSLAITDTISKGVAMVKADTMTIADTISKALGLPFADSLTIADFLIIGSAYNLSFSDTIALTDSITKDIGLTETDSVAIIEALEKVSEFVRTHSDLVTITDSIADAVEWLLSISDSLTLTDSISKGYGLNISESGGGFPLVGWAKRVKLTIDQTDIDGVLSDFPILVHLGTSVGRNADDVSFVFDELQNDANRKKIAVTLGEDTECYVEIEKWDDANEQAWLWVKVPAIASDADTDLYLYYDATRADNDTYVGDTNDVVSENVWDANFQAVYHMADGADNAHIYDSTANDKDGTKYAANEPNEVAGAIGKGQSLDGSNDDITIPSTSLTTLSALMNFYAVTSTAYFLGGSGQGIRYSGSTFLVYNGSSDWTTVNWTKVNEDVLFTAVKVSSTNYDLYINDEYIGTSYAGDSGGTINIIRIGSRVGQYYYGGVISEVRFSDIARTAAWIKASYESERDDLLDFGSEEISTGGFSITDSFSKVSEFYRAFTDTQAITDFHTKAIAILKIDTVALADALSKAAGLSFADSLALADSLTKGVDLTKSDSIAIADTMVKMSEFIRSHSDTIAITDSIADIVDWLLSVGDLITIADAATKDVGIAKSDTLTIADSLAKAVGLSKADTVAIADVIVKGVTIVKADTIAIADAISKGMGVVKADTLALADTIIKAVGVVKADTMTIADTVSMFIPRLIALVVKVSNRLLTTLRSKMSLITKLRSKVSLITKLSGRS